MSKLPGAAAPAPAPPGSAAPTDGEMTALKQHVSFFDPNGDGIIYPWDIYQGLRAVGLNVVASLFIAVYVGVKFHLLTRPGWLINPLFPIYVKNIHKTTHGSDTGIYDKNGRFLHQKFEEVFGKEEALTQDQVMAIVKSNIARDNNKGWFSATLEWKAMCYLANRDGKLHREDILAMYDGSLFAKMAKERASKKKN